MKRSPKTYLALAGATLAFTAAGASAATMHPELGAHLAGMGEHGVVNLQLTSGSGKLCWTFDVPVEHERHAAPRSASAPPARRCSSWACTTRSPAARPSRR